MLYLVINEIVEFELTEKEKAVADHISASAGCVGMLGASHVRKIHSARTGEGVGPGAGRQCSGGRENGAMPSPRRSG